MSRRYRRYNRYKKSRNYRSGPSLGEIMGLFLIASILFRQYWYIFLAVAVIAGIIFFVIRSRKSNSEPDSPESQQQAPTQSPLFEDTSRQTYSSKDSIMTDCERSFFDALTKILGSAYIIQPQINLASVINKDVHSRYQNELFRNIDFGIFDKNYSLKLLIEINDQSHTQKDRIERDKKVKSICAEAGIPLIAFWTKYGINEPYIRNRLREYLVLPEDTATE